MAKHAEAELASRPFTGWRKRRGADPEEVARLYRSGVTQKEIAQRLSISRQSVAELLAGVGVPRRESGRSCPVDNSELRRRVKDGRTQRDLALTFSAAPGTAGRECIGGWHG